MLHKVYHLSNPCEMQILPFEWMFLEECFKLSGLFMSFLNSSRHNSL